MGTVKANFKPLSTGAGMTNTECDGDNRSMLRK